MLENQTIMAFVSVSDVARGEQFYSDTLGLRLVSDTLFALVFDAGGTMLRISPVPQSSPRHSRSSVGR